MPATLSRQTAEYRIHGLDCAEEVSLLRKRLGNEQGIHDLRFDIFKAKMIVEFDPERWGSPQIERAVADTGLRAEAWRDESPPESFWQRRGRTLLVSLSGVLMLAAIVAQGIETGNLIKAFFAHDHDHGHMSGLVVALSLGAILAGSYFVLPKAWYSLLRLEPDMNLLVSISLAGAAYLGEWLEGASLAFLFALAALLESYSLARARRAVTALMKEAPGVASVVHGDHEHRVPVEKVGVASRVRVRPGERIPCDGRVIEGGSDVNQAMITGESVPVWKGPGDEVFAGTVNGDGMLEMETTRLAGETTLARIARVVERAQHQRAPAEHFVEKFARIYTPAVLLLALIVAVAPPLLAQGDWGYWFYQGMVILLISCPCALVISTPVTVVAALTSAARSGVLVKGGAYLEEAARLRAVAFDKTGVLTMGQPEVSNVIPLGGHTREQVLERLAAVEQGSRHPLAGAIVRYATSQGIRPVSAADFQTVRGKGAEAQVEGERYWAGSLRLLEEKGLANDELRAQIRELAASGGMTVAFGSSREPWALLSLADPVRPEAGQVTRELNELKLDEIVILTGDHPVAAGVIADQAGIKRIHADMLPADKAEAIDRLREKHGHVGMVGDGINDAQAMSHASLGVALGHASVDAVIETADVVLLSGGLTKLPDLLRLGRRTVAIIRQNIVIALALKAVFFGLAIFGLATLWMAVAADMGATLLVTFNGLRMLRHSRPAS